MVMCKNGVKTMVRHPCDTTGRATSSWVDSELYITIGINTSVGGHFCGANAKKRAFPDAAKVRITRRPCRDPFCSPSITTRIPHPAATPGTPPGYLAGERRAARAHPGGCPNAKKRARAEKIGLKDASFYGIMLVSIDCRSQMRPSNGCNSPIAQSVERAAVNR